MSSYRRMIVRNAKVVILYVFISLFASFSIAQAQNVSDYLILQDIGSYKFITQAKDFITGQIKTIPGYTVRVAPGILAGADHFDLDHDDKTYETDYVNVNIELAVDVQVTQHAGSDSDKWLLHEVERGFRSEDLESQFEGTIKEINGNKVITWLYGTSYRWISNNVVVYISYSDPQLTKPEPLEIVQAYLAKFPSTIVLTDAEAKSAEHNEQWIKDEMERRLWLCDKWFFQLQLQRVDLDEVLRETVDHMNVFLDYREKYYGVSAGKEKQELWEYLRAKDGTGIKNKLSEYKAWWKENKDKAINL